MGVATKILIRRRMLRHAGIAVASLALLPLAAWFRPARAGGASREDFHYQDQPYQGHRCADCAAFVAGPAGAGSCKLIAGPISANGWCMAFSKR